MTLQQDTARRCWRDFNGPLALLALYALMVASATAQHEPFSDEADGWLAARDLTFPQLFHYTRYVGNPAGWYLILMPLAKLGAPYASMQWINAAIATGAAALVLFRAPFPLLTRGLIVMGYWLAYAYAAIARNYALLALALFLVAALHQKRRQRPVQFALAVVLLALSTTHGALLAAIVFAAFLVELIFDQRNSSQLWWGAAIMLLGLAATAAQLWPPADGQRPGWLTLRHGNAPLDTLQSCLATPLGSDLLHPLWSAVNLAVIGLVVVQLWSRQRRLLLMLVIGASGMLYIFTFKWFVAERHPGILFLWIIFLLWIAMDLPQPPISRTSARDPRCMWQALNVALLISCLGGLLAWDQEMRVEYSHGKQMAQVIRSKRWDETQPIAGAYVATAVLPYLHCTQFWNINLRREASHNLWNREFHENALLGEPAVWERVEQFPGPRRPLVLWNVELFRAPLHGYKLIYRTTGPVGPSDEVFWLYGPVDDTR